MSVWDERVAAAKDVLEIVAPKTEKAVVTMMQGENTVTEIINF